jgi:predicted alpha-1,2-mannosidase
VSLLYRATLLALLVLSSFPLRAQDLAASVNPFVGSKLSSSNDYGKTNPGAVRPFGMLSWGPDTADAEFYTWEKLSLRGFSLTRTSGPGCGQFGDAPVMPIEGLPTSAQTPYRASFQHAHEIAEPGYYAVTFDSGIRVQLAAQVRSGIAQFDFPSDSQPHTLVFDLGHNLSPAVYETVADIHGNRLTGYIVSGNNCRFGKNRYKLYFAFVTDQTPTTQAKFDASGEHAGAYLSFASSIHTVRLKVGISYVSVANAEANLEQEIPGWNLESVRRDARNDWNNTLGHAVAQGGREADRRLFYTSLYHSLLEPSTFSDVNGQYIGFDNQVHEAGRRIQYANFSGWDIYRCEAQLLAMLFPQRASDMAQSLVTEAQQGGGLPVFPVANDEAHAMVGDPADGILAGFYAFGARDFDVEAAWHAMMRGADDPTVLVKHDLERPSLEEYLKLGYVAERGVRSDPSASTTLEYENADFAMARMAAALGDTKDAEKYLARSARWRDLFDPETRYIRPRDAQGKFLTPFSPVNETGFAEGNATQYTWMIPYDMKDVIQAVGGDEAASQRLDDYFSQYAGAGDKRGGHFNIANEPSFGNPWIYNWTGRPWRTQEVVRKTLRDLFSAEPDGLPGNDDLGATGAWVVFAQLGFYPAIPGVGGVTLHSPIFPEMTLLLGDHRLRITARGAPDRVYINKVELDGKPVMNWWLEWSALSHASQLSYDLQVQPNRQVQGRPPSFAPAHL